MKAAVIGCGRMGAEPSARLNGCITAGWLPISHIESILSVDDIDAVALCDTNEELLKRRGKKYQINALYTNHEDLITRFQPDIITIATRTPQKNEIIKYACKNGVKGIYVEKPLTNSLNELKECFFYIKKYNVQLFYGVNRRYHSVYRAAKKLIMDGEIGEVTTIIVEHGFSQLLWAHPHSVDLILFFSETCDVDTVQAHLVECNASPSSDYLVDSDPFVESMFFKTRSGVSAYITNASGLNVRVMGKKGNLTVHADGAYIQLNQDNINTGGYFLDQKNMNIFSAQSATVTAIKELIAAVNTEQSIHPKLDVVEIGMKMLLGGVWSHLSGNKTMLLSDIPPELIVTGKSGDLYA